jgi:hypothetical protein
MSEPAGLKKLARTKGQLLGDESLHNPLAPDSANGYLEGPSANVAHISPDLGMPTEGLAWAAKRRAVLRGIDEAKRKSK